MELLIPIIYTITISSVLLFIYLISKNLTNKVNLAFLYYLIASLLWIISNLLTDISKVESWALFWSRMTIIGPSFMPAFFLIFLLTFFNIKIKKVFY